jgi:hypothetical protein
VGFVENAVEVVEHIAEVTEKLAANVAKQLPEGGSLQKAVEEVEHIAVVVDDDAEKFEAVAEKVYFCSLVFLLFDIVMPYLFPYYHWTIQIIYTPKKTLTSSSTR